MSMESWADDIKADEAMDNHDREHNGDELLHWQEQDCATCEDRVQRDIASGVRCHHGELVPDRKNEYGYIITDIECPRCEIDLGKMVSADIDFSKHGL